MPTRFLGNKMGVTPYSSTLKVWPPPTSNSLARSLHEPLVLGRSGLCRRFVDCLRPPAALLGGTSPNGF
ncbi:MAG: hypothetical protein ACI84E_000981 [Planctomycetota bacterium]|jgi:hypothetical protein